MSDDFSIGDRVIWTRPNGACHRAKIVDRAPPWAPQKWTHRDETVPAYPGHDLEDMFVIEIKQIGKKTVPRSELRKPE